MSGSVRLFTIVGVLSATLIPAGHSARAQGGFLNWFGGGGQQQHQNSWFGQRQQPQQQYAPPQGNAYSDPSNPSDRPVGYGNVGAAPQVSSGGGRAYAYCVRLCDGRYFPMLRNANANPVQLCSAFCPAAKTQVFNGSQIDNAYASGGGRYADIENAFAYRQKIIPGCTCNGKDAFGLARIDVANDPTLRPGDVVASGDNVKAALIAMEAAREHQPQSEAVNEKTALRGSTAQRALPPGVKAITPAPDAPADAEPIPED